MYIAATTQPLSLHEPSTRRRLRCTCSAHHMHAAHLLPTGSSRIFPVVRMHHVACITSHASRRMHHITCITSHASRRVHHVACVSPAATKDATRVPSPCGRVTNGFDSTRCCCAVAFTSHGAIACHASSPRHIPAFHISSAPFCRSGSFANGGCYQTRTL